MHELDCYAVEVCNLLPETSEWQKLVTGDPAFDADRYFPSEMMVLDLGAKEPELEIRTAQQLQAQAQEGHVSLRAKYRDKEKQG